MRSRWRRRSRRRQSPDRCWRTYESIVSSSLRGFRGRRGWAATGRKDGGADGIVCCLQRPRPRERSCMSHIIWRLVRAGLAAALVVGASGWAIERARFGPTDQTALSRVEAELRQRLDASAETLGTIASQVASHRDIIRGASGTSRDVAAARRLFDVVDTALPDGRGRADRHHRVRRRRRAACVGRPRFRSS